MQQAADRMILQHVLAANSYVTSYVTIQCESEYTDLG